SSMQFRASCGARSVAGRMRSRVAGRCETSSRPREASRAAARSTASCAVMRGESVLVRARFVIALLQRELRPQRSVLTRQLCLLAAGGREVGGHRGYRGAEACRTVCKALIRRPEERRSSRAYRMVLGPGFVAPDD